MPHAAGPVSGFQGGCTAPLGLLLACTLHPASIVLQENAKLHYGNPADFTLTVPQFSIKPGEVVAIVGRVGCGE